MVHPEGVSHKGTKPDCADRGTELNGPHKTVLDRVSSRGDSDSLGYQKDVMDVELTAHYIESQTRSLQLA
jgi:hypothetical protein